MDQTDEPGTMVRLAQLGVLLLSLVPLLIGAGALFVVPRAIVTTREMLGDEPLPGLTLLLFASYRVYWLPAVPALGLALFAAGQRRPRRALLVATALFVLLLVLAQLAVLFLGTRLPLQKITTTLGA